MFVVMGFDCLAAAGVKPSSEGPLSRIGERPVESATRERHSPFLRSNGAFLSEAVVPSGVSQIATRLLRPFVSSRTNHRLHPMNCRPGLA